MKCKLNKSKTSRMLGLRALMLTLILFLLGKQINGITDLTYLNCPDNYQVSSANISNPSLGTVNFFFSLYDNQQHKQRVQDIVIQGKTQDLSVYISQMMVPYIVVGVFFFVFFMTVVCCNVFQKSCPPCESWRRDFTRRPYQKLQLRCVMVFTIIFAITIFVISIVMFTSFPVFKQQMEYTQCSIYNLLDITKNGEQTKNWGGFAQLKNQVGNISSLLLTASNQINSNFKGFNGLSDDQWIIQDMQTMKKANLDIYRNNNDSKVVTPNPTTTASVPVGGALPLVDSLFIKTGLGPNGTQNTMVDDIDKGLRNTEVFSQQAYLIQRQALILVDSATTITGNTLSSQKTLEMYQSQLVSIQSQLKVFSNDYFAKLFDWGLYIVEGVVGFILAASVFIIFGTISTHIFEILACRTMVNLGWVIYGIMYFVIVILVFGFLSGGSLAYSFCNYYDKMISNQTQFNRLGKAYSQNSFTRLDICLYGDGNVLKKFNIAEQMQTVTQVFSNIQTYYDYQNPTSVEYIDKENSTRRIQGWIQAMEKYRLGIFKDSNPSLTTDDNPLYALANLNKNTKYHYSNGSRNPNCPRDVWVFDSNNCTDPDAETYSATSSQSNGLRFTTLNDLCMSFNSKLFSSLYNSWNFRDFQKRYQQIIHECPVAYDDIMSYGNSLINYGNSQANIFQGLKDQLSNLLALNQQFNTNLGLYKSRVDNFYSSVSTLNNLVTDKISGLIVSSDCRVVSDYLKVTNNVFCKNVLGQVATLGICSVLLMVFMIGGIITASVLSVRYARIDLTQKNTRKIVIPENSLASQTFEKKNQSDDSSSSSSDED